VTPRAVLTALHRYAGLAMALFLVITGVTGAALAFYPELEAALNPEVFVTAPRGRTRLPTDELIARVHRARPRLEVEGVNHGPTPRDTARVLVRPRTDPATGRPFDVGTTEVFADPYDGRVLADRRWGEARADRLYLMPFLYSVHMSLHMPGRVGVVLLGLVALVWMVDCFVGAWLTLPVTGGAGWWKRWAPAWRIKRGAGATRLNFDLHRAGGLWFWAVAFVLAMSSVALNLADEVFQPLLRAVGTVTPDAFTALPERTPTPPRLSHEAAIAAARAALPAESRGDPEGYVSYLGEKHAYWVAFAPADKADRFWMLRYAHVFVDADDGRVVHLRTYAGGTATDRFGDLQYPLHSGQALGLPGRILVGVSGLAVAMLSVTGVIIWWKKRRGRLAARRRSTG